jgi:integral membrane sensor domain MASE1
MERTKQKAYRARPQISGKAHLSLLTAIPFPGNIGKLLRDVAQLAAAGGLYWAMARFGLDLASINASATPIWPPTGLALSAVLLGGYRFAIAVFVAALLANLETAGTISTSLAIAAGNTLEAIAGAALIRRFCSPEIFGSPMDVAKFALICGAAATPVSAVVGVGSLALAGFVPDMMLADVFSTWWLGDLGGAVVVTPPLVLWATSTRRSLAGVEILEAVAVFTAAAAVGLVAFRPFAPQATDRGVLAFLTILPLMWAALRCGQRETATAALIVSALAVWGTMAGSSPFYSPVRNDSFLLLLVFMISTVIPSLALASEVAARRRTEAELRRLRAQIARQSVPEAAAPPQRQRKAS